MCGYVGVWEGGEGVYECNVLKLSFLIQAKSFSLKTGTEGVKLNVWIEYEPAHMRGPNPNGRELNTGGVFLFSLLHRSGLNRSGSGKM